MSNVIILDLYRYKRKLQGALELIDYVMGPEVEHQTPPKRYIRTPCCGTDPLAVTYSPIEQIVLCEVCGRAWEPVP